MVGESSREGGSSSPRSGAPPWETSRRRCSLLLDQMDQTGWQLVSLRSAGLSFGSVLGTLAQGRCVPGFCVPRILQEPAELATFAPACAHVSMHTNLDIDSCCRARLAEAPGVPVTSILRFCPNARESTLGKSSLSTCRHPGGWEGWQFRPTPSPVPSGTEEWVGQSWFWACSPPPLPLLGQCPALGALLLLPSAWHCSARDFPAVSTWGVLSNWSEWIAQG